RTKEHFHSQIPNSKTSAPSQLAPLLRQRPHLVHVQSAMLPQLTRLHSRMHALRRCKSRFAIEHYKGHSSMPPEQPPVQGHEVSDEVALHLPDGQLVLKSGKVVRPVAVLPVSVEERQDGAKHKAREIKNGRQAQEALERIHRKLGDLPEDTEKMNAIACVLL